MNTDSIKLVRLGQQLHDMLESGVKSNHLLIVNADQFTSVFEEYRLLIDTIIGSESYSFASRYLTDDKTTENHFDGSADSVKPITPDYTLPASDFDGDDEDEDLDNGSQEMIENSNNGSLNASDDYDTKLADNESDADQFSDANLAKAAADIADTLSTDDSDISEADDSSEDNPFGDVGTDNDLSAVNIDPMNFGDDNEDGSSASSSEDLDKKLDESKLPESADMAEIGPNIVSASVNSNQATSDDSDQDVDGVDIDFGGGDVNTSDDDQADESNDDPSDGDTDEAI